MYTIYKHTFPNNKVYIGITSQSLNSRWRNGEGYKKQIVMYNAIQKYGWENIKHEIVKSGLSKEEAEQEEIKLIELYNSNDKKYGYNICSGGGVNIPTEEVKEKISKSHKGKSHSNETRKKISEKKKGTKLSAETRKRMSETRIGMTHKLSEEAKRKISASHKGMKHSEDAKRKMSESRKGINNPMYGRKGEEAPRSKPIVCIETGVEYCSAAEAARELKLHSTSVTQACKGKRKTCGGYHWKYKSS